MRLVSELLSPNNLNRLNRRIQEENIRQGMNTENLFILLKIAFSCFEFLISMREECFI